MRQTLFVVVALAGCEPAQSFEDAACPQDGTELTYENFGRAYLGAWCQTCHASTQEEDRRGAPVGTSFDDLEQVHAWLDRIYDRSAGDNVSMPPGPDDPPDAERDKLAEWLACGAPGGEAVAEDNAEHHAEHEH
jgi:uncharacterized membrane protein